MWKASRAVASKIAAVQAERRESCCSAKSFFAIHVRSHSQRNERGRRARSGSVRPCGMEKRRRRTRAPCAGSGKDAASVPRGSMRYIYE